MSRLAKFFVVTLLLVSFIVSSCRSRPRDCRGRKKTVKTAMGGWL